MKRTNEAGHVATFWQHVHVPNSNRKLASGFGGSGVSSSSRTLSYWLATPAYEMKKNCIRSGSKTFTGIAT